MTDNTPSSASETSPPAERNDSTDDDRDPIEVLHVEPDSRSAELLATFSERFTERICMRSAADLEAALAEIDEVDCVVTEQRLPDGSGVELVERLRRRGDEMPVVFHTTCRGEDTEDKAFGAGADAYFEKRSERGQYGCLLRRVRGLVDGDSRRNGRMSTTVSPETVGASGETLRSEE